MILGVIAFRASLEAASDPFGVPISQRLLPWLHEMECDHELDSIEEELLVTPFGHLNDSQRVDANWAGEAAMFFCWALDRAEPLEPVICADQAKLPALLCVLRPEAREFVRSASLREHAEIEDTCRQFVLICSALQESRVLEPHFRDVLRHMNHHKLVEVGVMVSEDAVKRASDTVAGMASKERRLAAGLYVVRAHAALWLLSDRRTYFESETDESEKL